MCNVVLTLCNVISTLFQRQALAFCQRCTTLKIRRQILFHFQRRINVISTLIRRWNFGYGNLVLKENKKGMNIWIDKNLIVHWNCSVSSQYTVTLFEFVLILRFDDFSPWFSELQMSEFWILERLIIIIIIIIWFWFCLLCNYWVWWIL